MASGILYAPRNFTMGGWGFSIISLCLTSFLTYYCSMLLLEVRAKIDTKLYTECGQTVYGKKGKILLTFALAASQIGFCMPQFYFILTNSYVFINTVLGINTSKSFLMVFWFVILSGLSYVRKVKIFAMTHVFADFIIFLTMFVIFIYCFQ